jgi:pSer/pThr/pTyr-binding forkhead associated (FHA) protein
VGSGSRTTLPPVVDQRPVAPVQRAEPHLLLDTGERVPLGTEPAIIGRLAGCAVVVSDLNVSRRHAQVRRSGTVFVVSDLGSTNGTMVNGSRIDGDTVLHDGDVISVGATQMRFEAS